MQEKAQNLKADLDALLTEMKSEGKLTAAHRQKVRDAFAAAEWNLPEPYGKVVASDKVDDEMYWSVIATIYDDVSLLSGDMGAQIAEYEKHRLAGTLEDYLVPMSLDDLDEDD